MRRNWTIALALAVVAAALALPGSASPQALIIGTSGEPGDGEHSVAPVSAEQRDGGASLSVDAGSGDGDAASAGTKSGDDGTRAVVGCIDGAADATDSRLAGSAGNCGSGSGGAAKGSAERDDTTAGLGLGCVALGLVGPTSGGARAGSCQGAGGAGGSDGGDGSGGGGSGAGESSGGEGTDGGSGAATALAGSDRRSDSGGSGSDGRQGSGVCGGFNQLASLAPGSLPAWLLALGALGAFASGALFARRHSRSILD